MSDDPVRTRVRTTEGWIAFQDYFVRRRCEPAVTELAFEAASSARPPHGIIAALHDPGLRAVVICPSNPFISVDPILAVPGIRTALAACAAPVVAVSPIIKDRAVKGPTAKMMAELGIPVTAAAVARHYGDLIDGYVVDHGDAGTVAALAGRPGPYVRSAATLMVTLADREALARDVMAFADTLRAADPRPDRHA